MKVYRIVHATCGRLIGWCSAPIYNHGQRCGYCQGQIDWTNAYIESDRLMLLRRAGEMKAEMRSIVDFHRVDMLRPPEWQQWTSSYC